MRDFVSIYLLAITPVIILCDTLLLSLGIMGWDAGERQRENVRRMDGRPPPRAHSQC